MSNENIPVITDREELYNKCENMEQLFDKYYLALLEKHYSKTYKLQQENQQLKEELELKSGMNIAVQNLKLIDENQQLKEVIEEVREYAKRFDIERLHETCEHNLAEVLEDLLQILDKARENK